MTYEDGPEQQKWLDSAKPRLKDDLEKRKPGWAWNTTRHAQKQENDRQHIQGSLIVTHSSLPLGVAAFSPDELPAKTNQHPDTRDAG